MAEALEKVKRTLGPDAVILHTRTLRSGGVLGVGARTVVEITASRDARALPQAERRAIIGRRSQSPGGERIARDGSGQRAIRLPALPELPDAEGAAMRPPAGSQSDPASRDDAVAFSSTLRDEMDELRGMVRTLLARSAASADDQLPHLPEELRSYYTRLIQNEVAAELAGEIMAEAQARLATWKSRLDEQDAAAGADDDYAGTYEWHLKRIVPEVLIESIERMLPPGEPLPLGVEGSTRYVALVGPTGVGKTTTIAKLAAHFKLREYKQVGLVTIDTYRIAAVEQLRAYADILRVPLEVVMTPDEMPAALGRLADRDLVLIDTSGRSQRDARRLDELQHFIDVAREQAQCSGNTGSMNTRRGRAHVMRGPDGRFRSMKNPPVSPLGEGGQQGNPPQSPLNEGGSQSVPRSLVGEGTGRLEVHLVLSCTAHRAQLLEAAEGFRRLGVDRIVFTKLDEAVGLGVVLDVIRRLNVQLSYLTTGQDVPDDIEIGHRRRIAELVLGRSGGARAVASREQPAAAVDQLA